MHSPIGAAALGVFGPPFIFAENDTGFSDVSDIKYLRHNLHSYNSMDVDDVLSIKLEHMVAGKFHNPVYSINIAYFLHLGGLCVP